MIYIASPYTSPDSDVREQRYRDSMHLCAILAERRVHCYSPINHWHPIAELYNLPKDFDYWKSLDEAMIQRCDAVWVLTLDGWEESKGVREEIKIAQGRSIPILYVDREGNDIYKAKKEPKQSYRRKRK